MVTRELQRETKGTQWYIRNSIFDCIRFTSIINLWKIPFGSASGGVYSRDCT